MRTWPILLAAVLMAPGGRTRLCRGFLPPNTQNIPVGASRAGLSEAEYDAVLERAEQVYAPIVRARGARLQLERDWKAPMLHAESERYGNTWVVRIYGAIARHPAMSREGFALVVCHELGHHLGGYPLWGWSTNEGGADYFATLKCLRRVLPRVPGAETDPLVEAACGAVHPDDAARMGCLAAAMAGLSAARVHQAVQGDPRAPSFAAPDPSVVGQMFPGHPAAQCRLDTYVQGALCAKSVDEPLSATDPAAGACTAKGGFRVGLRPRCWYKPPTDEPAPSTVRRAVSALSRRLTGRRELLQGRGL